MTKNSAATVLIILCLLFGASVRAQKMGGARLASNSARHSVELARAEAFSDGKGAYLRWQAASEAGNLGFNVYRVSGDRITLANPHLIGGAFLTSVEEIATGREYAFFDTEGAPGSLYYIESVGAGGQKQAFDTFGARAVSDLTEIAGASSDFLRRAAEEAQWNVLKKELILPKDLQTEAARGAADAPDPAAQAWIAAQPGVKIGVRQEGLYRVTRAELESAGFNTNSDSSLWQLYADGVEQPIIAAPNGDYIEFYGRPIDRLESNTQIYFLVAGTQNGRRIGTTVRRPVAGNVADKNYNLTFVKKERTLYNSNILNGEKENFFGSIINANGANVTFNLSAVDFSVPTVNIEITIQGLTLVPHQTRVVLNGEELGTISGAGTISSVQTYTISTAALREGANTLHLSALGGSSDVSLFDALKLDYTRNFAAEQNRLSFYTNNYKLTTVTGFTSPNVRVFDMTYADEPRQIVNLPVVQNGNTYEVRIPANRGRVMYAVADEALLSAASIKPNLPSSYKSPNHAGELVILTHRDWMTQAQSWASYRQADNLSVKTIDIEDVFDEFGYGVSSSAAVSGFLQYAHQNWQTPPRYVLLMGDASFDSKNYQGNGALNFIPTRLVDTVYMETGSDEALADFNDDGLAEIAVGRIPIRNGAGVTLAFNKVFTFEQSLPQAIQRGAFCASDVPNGYDFAGLCSRILDELPASIPKSTVNRADPDAQSLLLGQLNSGKYIANYSGHGSTGIWAAANFFSNTNAAQLNNGNNLSIFTMLTCLNGYFINPTANGLGETLLLNPNGGAVATWSSTGLTTPDVQEIMAKRFYNQLGSGPMNRIGDLIKDAKTTIGGGRDVRLSWVLLGDPTLKVK